MREHAVVAIMQMNREVRVQQRTSHVLHCHWHVQGLVDMLQEDIPYHIDASSLDLLALLQPPTLSIADDFLDDRLHQLPPHRNDFLGSSF